MAVPPMDPMAMASTPPDISGPPPAVAARKKARKRHRGRAKSRKRK